MTHNHRREPALEDEIAGSLDHGLSKQETAKELGISVELIDADNGTLAAGSTVALAEGVAFLPHHILWNIKGLVDFEGLHLCH